MLGNQNPRNVPPALPLGNQGSVGYVHGLQSSETWAAGLTDERQICDQLLAEKMWRVSVFGHAVSISVLFGTSRQHQINDLRVPFRMCVPGQLVIYAKPIPTGAGPAYTGSSVMVTCTPVNSAHESDARYLIQGNNLPLPDDAARFRATSPSVVSLGGSISVNLLATQWMPLIERSVLVSGDGYVEFEP